MARRDPLFVGASGGAPSYDSTELRGMLDLFQAGVIGAGDFKVTPGSGLSVSSAAGRALVFPTWAGLVFPGRYLCADDAAQASASFDGGGIPVNSNANPRLDAVVLRVYDHEFDNSGRREWVRQYVPGVAASGAALGGTLPALPTSSLLIAEVLVPANATSGTAIPSANIRDRRPWARGAFNRVLRSSNAGGGDDYVTASATMALIDATNLQPRIECSGNPLRVTLTGRVVPDGVPSFTASLAVRLDGSPVDGTGTNEGNFGSFAEGAAPTAFSWVFVPSAGSHRIGVAWAVSAQGRLYARSTIPLQLVVEELVRQNATND